MTSAKITGFFAVYIASRIWLTTSLSTAESLGGVKSRGVSNLDASTGSATISVGRNKKTGFDLRIQVVMHR
jgi:hypothetical protein